MKKLIKGSTIIALLLAVGTSSSSFVANADSMMTKSDQFDKLDKRIQKKLRGMAYGMSHTMIYAGKIELGEEIGYHGPQDSIPWSVSEVPVVVPNNDMKIVEGDALAANTTTFSNDTNTPMTYNTPSFSYKNTNTTTSTTTHSVDLSLTTSVEMKFPIASGSMSSTIKYNFSKGSSETNSEEYSWSVPTQNIPVEPHQKIRVDWVLKTGKAEGTVQLKDRIGAVIPYKTRKTDLTRFGKNIANTISDKIDFDQENWDRFVEDNREDWAVAPAPDNDKVDYSVGEARYSAKYGTEMVMKVVDVTEGTRKAKVIKTIPVKATVKSVK